jgi:hypothetical protein
MGSTSRHPIDDVIVALTRQHGGEAYAYTGSVGALDRANALHVERNRDELLLDTRPGGRDFGITQRPLKLTRRT